jgi:hypothetical protein
VRRWTWIAVVILLILAGIGIGVGAYNAGVDDGIRQGLEEAGRGTDVVRVIDPRHGYGHRGFLPFGFLLFPLFLIGIVLLLKAAFWRRQWYGPWGPGGFGWGPGHHGPEGGPPGHAGRAMFEEWHRREHERPSEQPGGGGEPGTP